jgi:hypothetical protein
VEASFGYIYTTSVAGSARRMPKVACTRCGTWAQQSSMVEMTAPVPAALRFDENTRDGLGWCCKSCTRRIQEHHKALREQPQRVTRSAPEPLPPPLARKPARPRTTEVNDLHASAGTAGISSPPHARSPVSPRARDRPARFISPDSVIDDHSHAKAKAAATDGPSTIPFEPFFFEPVGLKSRKPWVHMSAEELLPILRAERAEKLALQKQTVARVRLACIAEDS